MINKKAQCKKTVSNKSEPSTYPEVTTYVNISNFSKYDTSPCNNYDISVDRVNFSVNFKYLNLLREELKAQFKFVDVNVPSDGKTIWKYLSRRSYIQLIRYDNSCWCSVCVHDVSSLAWRKLLKALFRVVSKDDRSRSLSLNQCELAVDYYPSEGESIVDLGKKLISMLSITHSRIGMLNDYIDTVYFGKDGNVRAGSKGIRCYPKPETGAYRIELQLNRKVLRSFKLSPYRYPLDEFSPFSYINFRRPINTDGLIRLHNTVLRKKGLSHRSEFANAVRLALTRNDFDCRYCEKKNCTHFLYGPLVQCQIDAFKRIVKRTGLKYGVDYFFPKSERTVAS